MVEIITQISLLELLIEETKPIEQQFLDVVAEHALLSFDEEKRKTKISDQEWYDKYNIKWELKGNVAVPKKGEKAQRYYMLMHNVRNRSHSVVKEGIIDYRESLLISTHRKHLVNIKNLVKSIEQDININNLTFNLSSTGIDFKLTILDETKIIIINTQFCCLHNPNVKPDYMFLINKE